MNDLLPWVKCLIENTVFKQTTLAEDAHPSDPFIAVDSVSWFSAGDQIIVGDVVATIESIEIDPYVPGSGLLLLCDPLGIDANAGAPVKKLRANDEWNIYVGDYNKTIRPPYIRLDGASVRSETMTLGAVSFNHEVIIDVAIEAAEHTEAYMSMLSIAKEIFNVLLRYRSLDLTSRYFFNAMPDLDYGTIQGTTLSAAQIVWRLREEVLLWGPPPSADYDAANAFTTSNAAPLSFTDNQLEVVTISGTVSDGYTSLTSSSWNVNEVNVKRIRVETDSQQWTIYILPRGGERPDLLFPSVETYILQGSGPQDVEIDWPYQDKDGSRSVHVWWKDIEENGATGTIEVTGAA